MLILLSLASCIAAFAPLTHAQPVVTITATDDVAAETWPGQAPNVGTVQIVRSGGTGSPLAIGTRLRGDAVLGVDYTISPAFGSTLIFPAGQSTLTFTISPLDDLTTELAEIVRLEVQSASGAVPAYLVGGNGRAEVSIEDNDDPNTPPQAVVHVVALSPAAAEGTNGSPVPGAFRITREVNTNVTLTVSYELGGSATPGLDYAALPGSVVIPAGELSADVIITPNDDTELEDAESVTLRLLPAACPGVFPPPADCHRLGSPWEATLMILDNEIPPPPPVVVLSVAQDSGTFGIPALAQGAFTATATNGYIVSYAVRLDGVVQFSGITDHPEPPAPGTPFSFSFTLSNLSAAQHIVQATVVDDQGLTTTTSRVLSIFPIPPPPPRPPPIRSPPWIPRLPRPLLARRRTRRGSSSCAPARPAIWSSCSTPSPAVRVRASTTT